jgi:hypothetical protein
VSRVDLLTQMRVRLTHATTQVSPASLERFKPGPGFRCALQCREHFAAAMVVAARKVEKKDKTETPTEMFVRINAAKVVKENKSAKSAAKKLVKKKKLTKISTFFSKQSEMLEMVCFFEA